VSERFRLGVNYWPARTGMYWWSHFEAEDVKRDFYRIRDAGVDCARIFLLWEDFQPRPDAVSRRHIELLRYVSETAAGNDLKLIVTLFTGHMSGANFLPFWALAPGDGKSRFPVVSNGDVKNSRPRDWYADPEVREAQALLALEVAIALSDQPAVWAYDLGNENSNVVVPHDVRAGSAWLGIMHDALREGDHHRPITLGMHMEDLEEDRRIGPAQAAQVCDFLSMHCYPVYTEWCAGPTDAVLLPFLALITQWLGGKDVLFEEFGAPTLDDDDDEARASGVPLLREDQAAAYTDHALRQLLDFGSSGALVWCFTDYDRQLWKTPPLDRAPHERHFGLWRADRSPKPALEAVSARANAVRGGKVEDYTWIDIEREAYYERPKENLKQLYARFREHFNLA
jgi:endo-1,4-beta-mannosidase